MEFVILGFAVYYVTTILVFAYDDIGPLPSTKTYIQYAAGDGVIGKKPVDLFDRFRYIFGAYRIDKNSDGQAVWFVKPYAMLLWSCPTCLSFWIGIAIGGWFLFFPDAVLIKWLAVAGFVTFISRFHS